MDLNKDFWIATYDRNIKKLIGICFRYVSDRQIAEDLAHDSFLIAMKKCDTFRSKGHFDAWLRRITVNIALQHLREARKIQGNRHEMILKEPIDNDEKLDTNHDFTTQELFGAINKLPEYHRQVFNLHVIDGYSHKQIAEKLQISEGTSKSHLARGKRKLQQILNEKQYEKRTKELFIFILFPGVTGDIRELYKSRFSGFEIAPQHESFLESFDWNIAKQPTFNPCLSMVNGVAAVGIIVIISGTILFSKTQNKVDLIETSFPPQTKDSVTLTTDKVPETKTIENPVPVVVKKKRKGSCSDTLTINE